MTRPRTSFPRVFWIANSVEILERFAYYGIYIGFPVYFATLGYKNEQLGLVQGLFLFISYTVPVLSGTFADRFGFKKVLLISYLAYLPSILLLIFTKSFSSVALSMLSIGLAAGIFKPLISGTVRVVTDSSNRTLGFGIFYAMVNIGASFGPMILGNIRAVSWEYAYLTAALSVGLMFLVTLLFYKEPERALRTETLSDKFRDMRVALSDVKFVGFLVILGLFFWLPFWSFFNLCTKYIETSLDGTELYRNIRSVFGSGLADFLSRDYEGTRKVLGETISHTGWVIMAFQVIVSWIFERFRPIPSFIFGLLVLGIGFGLLGLAGIAHPAWIFPGILLVAIGEMVCSPRIQEYITWLAPKEKAGLYMGSNFLAIGIGGFLSGVFYTSYVYNYFEQAGHTEYLWLVLGLHVITGMAVVYLFSRFVGHFKEQEA